jgi:peptide-methionine (S)-S-oxide reductase
MNTSFIDIFKNVFIPIRQLFLGIKIISVGLMLTGATFASSQSTNTNTNTNTKGSSSSKINSTNPSKAIFAGGCFWCVEYDFDKVPGVISTTSGYIGGKLANPNYEAVSSKNTGHAEAVEILFDSKKISYRELVDIYWKTIDPTVKDQQFCDYGNPYRTAIFAVGPEQLKIAQESKAALEKTKPFKETIQTELVLATIFYPAEDYHQDYYKKNPVRYKYYRNSCGRDARLAELWGKK